MSTALPLLLCTLAAADGADSVEALVRDALASRPELAGAAADERAAKERGALATALPDPMLELGVQNDGFDAIRVGEMGSSYVLVMATQRLPFPGKRALQGELADDEARLRALATDRLRRSTIAEVRRAFLAAQLAHARLALVERLSALLDSASALARSRYETGGGSQAELLRARLEQGRLRQRRARLDGELRLQLAALARLAGRPSTWRPDALTPFDAQNFPRADAPEATLARALDQTPELLAARAEERRGAHGLAAAERAALPDLTVGAGVMLRGALPPMWSLTFGVPLPVFGATTAGVAVATEERAGAGAGVAALEQLVTLRARQRAELRATLLAQWRAFDDGLLADAASITEVTLAQLRVGGATLSAVLDANAAALALQDEALAVLAEAQALQIGEEELSLAAPAASATAMGGTSIASGDEAPAAPSSRRAGGGEDAASPAGMGM